MEFTNICERTAWDGKNNLDMHSDGSWQLSAILIEGFVAFRNTRMRIPGCKFCSMHARQKKPSQPERSVHFPALQSNVSFVPTSQLLRVKGMQ
jgi:hypothetical protein